MLPLLPAPSIRPWLVSMVCILVCLYEGDCVEKDVSICPNLVSFIAGSRGEWRERAQEGFTQGCGSQSGGLFGSGKKGGSGSGLNTQFKIFQNFTFLTICIILKKVQGEFRVYFSRGFDSDPVFVRGSDLDE